MFEKLGLLLMIAGTIFDCLNTNRSMLKFQSLSVLFRESAWLQSMISMDAQIKVIINGTDSYLSKESPIKKKLALWRADGFPDIAVQGYADAAMMEFIIMKNKEQVGRAKSVVRVGRNKKDCLDLANKDFQIVGKFIYEVTWKNADPYSQQYNANPYQQQSQYHRQPQYQQQSQYQPNVPVSMNTYPSLDSELGINPYYNGPQRVKPVQKYQEAKKVEAKSGILSSMLCCFGAGHQKPQMKKVKFGIEPIVMTEQDLPYAPESNTQPFQVQYYSRRFGQKFIQA